MQEHGAVVITVSFSKVHSGGAAKEAERFGRNDGLIEMVEFENVQLLWSTAIACGQWLKKYNNILNGGPDSMIAKRLELQPRETFKLQPAD